MQIFNKQKGLKDIVELHCGNCSIWGLTPGNKSLDISVSATLIFDPSLLNLSLYFMEECSFNIPYVYGSLCICRS